jgi:hypothetical protein
MLNLVEVHIHPLNTFLPTCPTLSGHALSADQYFRMKQKKRYFDFPTAESPNNITLTTLSSTLAAPAMDQGLDNTQSPNSISQWPV